MLDPWRGQHASSESYCHPSACPFVYQSPSKSSQIKYSSLSFSICNWSASILDVEANCPKLVYWCCVLQTFVKAFLQVFQGHEPMEDFSWQHAEGVLGEEPACHVCIYSCMYVEFGFNVLASIIPLTVLWALEALGRHLDGALGSGYVLVGSHSLILDCSILPSMRGCCRGLSKGVSQRQCSSLRWGCFL